MLSASLQGMARSSSPSESASTGAIEEGRVRTGKDASVPKVPSPFPGKQAEGLVAGDHRDVVFEIARDVESRDGEGLAGHRESQRSPEVARARPEADAHGGAVVVVRCEIQVAVAIEVGQGPHPTGRRPWPGSGRG